MDFYHAVQRDVPWKIGVLVVTVGSQLAYVSTDEPRTKIPINDL